MAPPNKPADTVQVTTGLYRSIKNIILEKLKPAKITRKRYEDVTTKAVVHVAKKYAEEGYSFKLWKTELLIHHKLFRPDDKFPGIRPQSNKEKAATASKAQANSVGPSKPLGMAPRPVFGGKTIPSLPSEDTPMTDDAEPMTTETITTPKFAIRSTVDPTTSFAGFGGYGGFAAPATAPALPPSGNLGATKPRATGEKTVPAKPTSQLDFLPEAQPAGIKYCKTWPSSGYPYTEPAQESEPKKSAQTLAEQETEQAWNQATQKVANRKADQEHWTQYRQGVLDGRAKRENDCKTDALRAKNVGDPLLPLKEDSMPQFSVIATFALPIPDHAFKGKWGKRNLAWVQGNLQVLIRYKHFGDKFVVWVEPKKAKQKDSGRVLDICYETVGFLKSWESTQAKTVRRIRLNEHYKAWKAGSQGVERSIYRKKNYKEWDEYEAKSRDWVHLEEKKEYYNGWKSGPGKESVHVQRSISREAQYDEWQEKPKDASEKVAEEAGGEKMNVDEVTVEESSATEKVPETQGLSPNSAQNQQVYDEVTRTTMPLSQYEDLFRERILAEIAPIRPTTPEPRGRKRARDDEEDDYAADDEDARPRFSPFGPKKTSARGLGDLLDRLSVSPPGSAERGHSPVKKARKNLGSWEIEKL